MLEIEASAVIPASAEAVWVLLRDFAALPDWNAAVRNSRIENGPPDRIGCRRVLTFDDGSVWTHELTALSDADMTISYAIVGAPPQARMPFRDYRATIEVDPVHGEAKAVVTWHASFETDDEATARGRAAVVLQAGLDGLKRHFAG